MEAQQSKVTVHMVASLDGFISKKDESFDWMQSSDTYDEGIQLSQEQIESFLKSIDCYVMGSRTYELALKLGWPYGEVPVVVLSHRKWTSDRKQVTFYDGDLEELLSNSLRPNYRNIWVVGGSIVTKAFMRAGLVDEINMTILPVILGDGLLFFDYLGVERKLHLKRVRTYKDGMVELNYVVKNSND